MKKSPRLTRAAKKRRTQNWLLALCAPCGPSARCNSTHTGARVFSVAASFSNTCIFRDANVVLVCVSSIAHGLRGFVLSAVRFVQLFSFAEQFFSVRFGLCRPLITRKCGFRFISFLNCDSCLWNLRPVLLSIYLMCQTTYSIKSFHQKVFFNCRKHILKLNLPLWRTYFMFFVAIRSRF